MKLQPLASGSGYSAQYAARLTAEGALGCIAAMDAGFADTAHLTRVFRQGFG